MDAFITYTDAFRVQPKDWLYEILNWLTARDMFDLDLNPTDHPDFFEIPAYLREGWDK